MRDNVVLCGFIPEITLYKYKSRMRFNNSVSTTPRTTIKVPIGAICVTLP